MKINNKIFPERKHYKLLKIIKTPGNEIIKRIILQNKIDKNRIAVVAQYRNKFYTRPVIL